MSERREVLYEFGIGKPVNFTPTMFVPFKNAEDEAVILGEYEDRSGYLFTTHQVKFNVNLSTERKEANSATITLYNLEDDAVQYLVQNADNSLAAFLRLGDNASGLKTVFQGIVQKVVDSFPMETRTTAITISDAGMNIKNAYSVRAWPRGTKYSEIATDLISDLKLPIGTLCKIDDELDTPENFMGSTYQMIDQMFGKKGYKVSVVNGYVNILPKNARLPFEASFLTPETGLIGEVSNVVDLTATGVVVGDSETDRIQFECLIDGSLLPEQTVYVQQGKFDGAYKIKDVVFKGDYEGNQWTCDVVAAYAKEIAVVEV
ncbi:hypothetical protein NVP1084O_170 [Vibrio phage 1.084.O._10N.261.49.F5]|nr:hypothetical protein NVP1084O_170 [Vibrio phage 1.084.O._10N.261.49.F5]